MSIWDDPELRSNNNFVEFANVGDSVSGKILAVTRHRFEDGRLVPKLLIKCDDGEERTLTAGQFRLKTALVEQRPEQGDHIKATLSRVEKLTGGKTLKHFDVVITRGTGAPATASAETVRSEGGSKPPF